MSLFEELKRRNVIRVGIAYVVTAWLVAQIADLVLDNIDSPDWVMQVLMLVLALGLPFALIFAWAFELTPEGIKKEKDVDRTQSITHVTGRKLDFAIIGVLAVAVVFLLVDRFTGSERHFPAPVTQAPVAAEENVSLTPSIAVLPFVNMSSDEEQEYFSDGISEEILNALAKVKDLKVAGRTSSFAFKGQNQDLRKIGEALGVAHILEGSVRKAGAKVRITAQLIQVEDGFHLWSETYDRELTDVFAIQDEIANAILQQLKARLMGEEATEVIAARANTEAYDLYLLAKQRMYDRTRLSLESAAKLLDRAIAIDPEYAPAYAERGITALLLSETSYGDLPHQQASTQAKLYLDKAMMLDQNLAEAWAGLGLYYNGPPPQPAKGIPALEKALAINPNLINASNWLTLSYWGVNRMTESLALLDAIAERDPLYKPAIGNRAFQLSLMGRGNEAREWLDTVEPFLPGDPQIESSRAAIDLFGGKVASGLKRSESILELQPTDRTFKAAVNQGNYLTHQYERVFDDRYTDYEFWALFNLGRTEEAAIVAQEKAASGIVTPLFALLNANDQSELLIAYLEERWSSLDEFQQDVPPNGLWGYREMADIALAYRRAGKQQRFEEAMGMLGAASERTLAQGMKGNDFLMVVAAYHAMAGEQEEALARLAQAIDGGLIASSRISKEYPYFRELDGHPEYEAIQARMLEHLNRERAELGLEPVSV